MTDANNEELSAYEQYKAKIKQVHVAELSAAEFRLQQARNAAFNSSLEWGSKW